MSYYGTDYGLSLNFADWDLLTAPTTGPFTATVIEAARLKADSYINTKLAMAYYVENLPITTPQIAVDIVNTISDDLTSYYLARSRYTEEDPNENDWVGELWDKATTQLDFLISNNLILQNQSPIDGGDTNRDPIFGMQTTEEGEDVLDSTKTSMDEIQEVTYAG